MADQDLSELSRRVAIIEQEIEGEKRVTRHILRKVTENEASLLDVRAELGHMRKDLSELRNEVALLRADLPGIISAVVGALLRENKQRL